MKNRKVSIETIRLLSVIIVLLFHVNPNLFGFGYLGVDFFFILSGYFAANHLLNNKVEIDLFTYLCRRFLRIMPAVICCVMFLLICQSLIGLPYETESLIYSMMPVILTISNFYFWRQNDYFAFTENFEPLLHTWSTSVELQFFVSFAFCAFLLGKYIKLIPFLITIVSISMLSFLLLSGLHSRPGAYFLLPFRLWEFAIGVFTLYLKNAFEPNWRLNLPSNIGIACIFILILSLYYLKTEILYLDKTYFFVIGIFTICFFMVLHGYEQENSKYNEVIIFFSKFTFALFVVHYPIISIFKEFFKLNEVIDYICLCSIIFILTVVLYRITDFYYFQNNTKLLFRLTSVYLIFSIILSIVLIKSDYTLNKSLKRDMLNSSLISEILQYDIKKFKSYVVGSFDRDLAALDEEKPILIVGDSFAKDFYNILLEGNLAQKELISLHYVPANCGFIKIVQPVSDEFCKEYKAGLWEKFNSASTIIAANYWRTDTLNAELVNEFDYSILRNKNLIFVHEKVAKFPRLRELLYSVSKEKYYLKSIEDSDLNNNKSTFNALAVEEAKRVLELDYYSSIENCDSCFPIATSDNLLTHDGQHLTKAGAIYFARVFEGDLRPFLSDEKLH